MKQTLNKDNPASLNVLVSYNVTFIFCMVCTTLYCHISTIFLDAQIPALMTGESGK